MTYLWTTMVCLSLLFACATGRSAELSSATLEGASTAVNLCISMTGGICLWSGMMEVLRQCGVLESVAKALSPLLKWLYPETRENQGLLEDISANVSANLLGLGNAATPMGLKAAKSLSAYSKHGRATPSLCLFIVCNTASIQLLPTTIATLRAACGSETPLDILPAVWLSSLGSVTLGIAICKLLERLSHKRSRL